MYSIEELVEVFSKHAKKTEEVRLEMRKSFQENNLGEELPDYMLDDFNISKAFSCMCLEIWKLKNEKKHQR